MKEISNLKYLLLISIFCLPFLVSSQEASIVLDSSFVEQRKFDEEKIKSYQIQRVYNYEKNPKYEQNVFRRLWYNFLQKIRQRLGEKTMATTWQIIQYLLILGAFGLILNFLLKSNKTRMFKKGDSSPDFDPRLIENSSGDQNIQTMIRDAEKVEDYSNAVRYLFLNVLHKLNQENFIIWKDYKTNAEYINEIRSNNLRNDFEDLSHIFEYVVYGEFELTKEKYNVYKLEFGAFINQLSTKKV